MARRTASLSRWYATADEVKLDAGDFVEILTPVDIFPDEMKVEGASSADNLLGGRHARGAPPALAAAHDLAMRPRARVDDVELIITALQALKTE
jgi:hypothetical protein